jgi:hypothetical protein
MIWCNLPPSHECPLLEASLSYTLESKPHSVKELYYHNMNYNSQWHIYWVSMWFEATRSIRKGMMQKTDRCFIRKEHTRSHAKIPHARKNSDLQLQLLVQPCLWQWSSPPGSTPMFGWSVTISAGVLMHPSASSCKWCHYTWWESHLPMKIPHSSPSKESWTTKVVVQVRLG